MSKVTTKMKKKISDLERSNKKLVIVAEEMSLKVEQSNKELTILRNNLKLVSDREIGLERDAFKLADEKELIESYGFSALVLDI